MSELAIAVFHETEADAAPIERLHARAFGPGRYARTAFRLREGTEPIRDLCLTARVGTLLVGSVRLSPLLIGADTPAVLLGPITIEPVFQSKGVGSLLMNRALEDARKLGHKLLLLVGDEPYYRRFGFKPVPRGRLSLPAPVDPARFLVCELAEGAFEGVNGLVRARKG